MSNLKPHERIIVALDVADHLIALGLAAKLKGRVGAFKIGLELVNATGPAVVSNVGDGGTRVFYDAKFHDIPNTVAGAVRQAVQHRAWMVNVHAMGGVAMMQAAVQAAASGPGGARPLVIAVTVLTSLDAAALHRLGVDESPEEHVVRLARLAQESGLDGVVASPLEAGAVRAACGPDFVIVTPGVRPAGAATDDQARLATPAAAVAAGADYVVVGRPIVRAPDPVAAAELIGEELRRG